MSTHPKQAVLGAARGRPAVRPWDARGTMTPITLRPKQAPPQSSWWLCDRETFVERLKGEAKRMAGCGNVDLQQEARQR